jgi:hypothetical protein
VFALDLLGMAFAWLVLISFEMTRVSAPVVRIIASDAKRLELRFELEEDLILAAPKDISQHLTTAVINRMPKPSLISFLAHVRPELVHFRFLGRPNDNRHLIWIQQSQQTVVYTAE